MDITNLRWTFLKSQNAEKFPGVTIQCFRHTRVSTNFMHKKGISLVCAESFLCQDAEKTHRGTLLCFEKTLASNVFMQRRGAYSFVEKLFCFTGPKNFVSVNSVFQKFSGVDNKLLIKDGGCPVFASICLTHSTGIFCGILFNVSGNFGYWTISCIKKRISLPSVELFWSLRMPKSFLGYLFNVSDILGYRQTLWLYA